MEQESKKAHIDFDSCPNCKHPLRFDVYTGKKHCDNCGKIWTFDIEGYNVVIREWKQFKPLIMKKLSIEEKAKRYDEAIEGIQEILSSGQDSIKMSRLQLRLQGIFPELKESEDEKIRKELIEHIKANKEADYVLFKKFSPDDVIAWLEKQGQVKESIISQHENRTCKENDDSLTSEDERVRKHLISLVKNWDKDGIFPKYTSNTNDIKQILAWLEKQGEQKSFDYENANIQQKDFAPKVEQILANSAKTCKNEQKPAKNIVDTWKDMRLEVYQQASGNRHEPNCSDDTTKMFSLNDIDEIIEKLSEHKSDDKVKFKVGNWYQCTKDFFGKGVTFDKNTAYYCAEEGCLQNEYGCHIAIVKDLYDNFKLWTIADAKDGDVLLASDGSIFIFKEVFDLECKHYIALAANVTIQVNDNFAHCWESVIGVCPASKEQRDILMKAMTDAGWEFDFDKKELKKIENEIEIPFGAKDSELQEVAYYIPKGFHAEIDDGKVVIKKGENPAWGEEDAKKLNRIFMLLGEAADEHAFSTTCRLIGDKECVELQDFLRSLKPQTKQEWKPSEEQMKALNYVLNLMASSESPKENDYYYNVFKDLRIQLKKL